MAGTTHNEGWMKEKPLLELKLTAVGKELCVVGTTHNEGWMKEKPPSWFKLAAARKLCVVRPTYNQD